MVGLITDNDETTYREEVRDLAVWCQDNNLSLDVIKTKEMIVNYRKRRTERAPILINGATVEQVESFKFLGVHITNKLPWSKHTKTVVKSTTKPIPPQETEKIWNGSSDPQKVLQLHHREHPGCITGWYGNCSASDRKSLQRVVLGRTHITGAKLPAIQDLYTRRCQRKALKLPKTPATLVIDCSLCYSTASSSGVDLVSSLGPRGF